MGILKGIIDRFRAMGNDFATGKNGNFENEQFERCGKPQKHE